MPSIPPHRVRVARSLLRHLTYWATFFGIAVVACAQGPRPDDGQSGPQTPPPQTVSNGFLVVNGVYVAPPYEIEHVDGAVVVNGHQITPQWDPNSAQGGPWMGMGNWGGPRRGQGRAGMGRFAARRAGFRAFPGGPTPTRMGRGYARELENDSVLIAFDNQLPAIYQLPQSSTILTTLTSSESTAAKLAIFADAQFYGAVTPQQWEEVIAKFQPTSELNDRVALLQEKEAEIRDLTREASDSAQWYELLASPSSKYGITLVAMVLAVVAAGNLMLYRPHGQGSWSEKTDSGSDAMDVRRIVIILALLGGFDLVLTLAAQKAGGFLELNPLGSELISSPILLAVFKLTTLVCACTILLKLRDYRGAQVASWWLCMVCTVLTFRWVTFNSLFFS